MRNTTETMDVKERILYICDALAQKECSVKQLAVEIFGEAIPKKVRIIQQDIKMLRERYPEKIYSPRRGYYKFVSLPDFMEKLKSNDVEELSELFEFIALFDAKMIKIFEQSEPQLVKKLKREIRSIYHIKDDPIEHLKNSEIWHTLKKGVKEKRYLSIAYEKEKLIAYNAIRPIKIVFARNNWYLAAINTEEEHDFEFTFFRISHIVAAKILPTTFHEDIEALKFLENLQSLFERYKVPHYQVRLLAKPDIAPYFRHKKYLKSQQITGTREDGALELSYQINNTMEIIPLIKRWLPDLVVLEPESLREELETILSQYDAE